MTEVDRSAEADAKRFRWLLAGNGYFMEEEFLCGHEPTTEKEQDEARRKIDEVMSKEEVLGAAVISGEETEDIPASPIVNADEARREALRRLKKHQSNYPRIKVTVQGRPMSLEARVLGAVVMVYGEQTKDGYFELDIDENLFGAPGGFMVREKDGKIRIEVTSAVPLRREGEIGRGRYVMLPPDPGDTGEQGEPVSAHYHSDYPETRGPEQLRELIDEMRVRAAPIGPLHSFWDMIFDAEAFLEGKETIVGWSLDEWIEQCEQALEGP